MKNYNHFKTFNSNTKTILTIGTFDGVHIGHKKILENIVQEARDFSLESLVLTFFPHPRMVLQKDSNIKLINTIDEKKALLDAIGINHLIIQPFDREFSRLTAEEFVEEVLVKHLNVKKIIIGYDHRFGRNRTATIDDLIQFGEKYNFEVEQISAESINESTVSSTKIRKALESGNIELANSYLGYSFSLNGKVVTGNKIGRSLNFPTANLQIKEDYKLIPNDGVYFVSVVVDNLKKFGLVNIGNKPTLENSNHTIEVFILDFDENIYDKNLTLYFFKKIRDEKKFNSLSLLQNQIELDVAVAKKMIPLYENQFPFI